jgi:hypothetical protein
LDLRRLASELCGLERRPTRGGRDSIGRAPGAHNDIANAVAGALLLVGGRKPLIVTDDVMAYLARPAGAISAAHIDELRPTPIYRVTPVRGVFRVEAVTADGAIEALETWPTEDHAVRHLRELQQIAQRVALQELAMEESPPRPARPPGGHRSAGCQHVGRSVICCDVERRRA